MGSLQVMPKPEPVSPQPLGHRVLTHSDSEKGWPQSPCHGKSVLRLRVQVLAKISLQQVAQMVLSPGLQTPKVRVYFLLQMNKHMGHDKHHTCTCQPAPFLPGLSHSGPETSSIRLSALPLALGTRGGQGRPLLVVGFVEVFPDLVWAGPCVGNAQSGSVIYISEQPPSSLLCSSGISQRHPFPDYTWPLLQQLLWLGIFPALPCQSKADGHTYLFIFFFLLF